MPDPDPQPPQPRPVSAARWLLMLMPSVVILALPIIYQLFHWHGPTTGGSDLVLEIPFLILGVMLCFAFGFALERWPHGKIESTLQAIGNGFMILIVNGVISRAGCAVTGWMK